jgi:GNAT superfamily N-acetyltransferase
VGEVTVRRAARSDGDRRRLAAVRRAWAQEDVGGPIDDPGYEDRAAAWVEANERTRTAWLAELDGEPIGMLVLVTVERMPEPGKPPSAWGYVHHLVVLPGHRDAGVGQRLMAAAVAEAEARGWAHLLLNPRSRSLPFYERWGFEPAREWLARRHR